LRGDLHRLPGLRVAARAGLPVRDRELAEAGQPHFVAGAHLLLDRLQRRLESALRLSDAEPASLGDVADQLILSYECHRSPPNLSVLRSLADCQPGTVSAPSVVPRRRALLGAQQPSGPTGRSVSVPWRW